MTLHPGWVTNSASTALDARLQTAGQLTKNADGSVRTGVLWVPGVVSSAIGLSGATGMNVIAGPAAFVCSKSIADGATLPYNDANMTVPVGPAATGPRTDIVYVKQSDSTTGDSVSTVAYGVANGSYATPTTDPAIPTGATALARLVFSAATGTTQSNTTVIQIFQFTSMQGGPVFFRSLAEMYAATPEVYTLGKVIDASGATPQSPLYIYPRGTGTWRPCGGGALASLNASGSLASSTTPSGIPMSAGANTDQTFMPFNASGIVPTLTGQYRVTATMNWATNATGARGFEITANGSSFPQTVGDTRAASGPTNATATGVVSITAGQAIRLQAFQSSGAALAYAATLTVEFLG